MKSSSKVILIGAMSVMIGMYASALKNVQSQQFQSAQMNVNRVQRLYSADAAMRCALYTYAKVNQGKSNVSEMGKKLPNGGGTFTNKITKGSLNAVDSVTITYPDGSTQLITAIVTSLSGTQKYPQGARKIHCSKYTASQIVVRAVKKPNS